MPIPSLKDSPTDDLTPAERRELIIAQSAATLVRSLLHEQISKIEQGAAEAAEDSTATDDAKPVAAKVSIAIEWPAGSAEPDIDVALSYNLRRKTTATIKADPDQLKLSLETSTPDHE